MVNQGQTESTLWQGRLRRSPVSLAARAIQVVAGASLATWLGYHALSFPVFEMALCIALALYFLLLLAVPAVWLLILPGLYVGLDLTPYSGRPVFNELDYFIYMTLAAGLCNGTLGAGFSLLSAGLRIALAVLIGMLTMTLVPPDTWVELVSPLSTNAYYSPLWGYKVTKGLLWGLFLALLWQHHYRQAPQAAPRLLLGGFCVAALLLGGIILWERHTLHLILTGAPWYHIATSLLDFTSSYRITGWFSDMHTGGESIDGMMILLFSGALGALFAFRSYWLKLFAMASVVACAYCILVGFTRSTYVAMLVATLVFGLFYVRSTLGALRAHVMPITLLLVALACGVFVFRAGSYFGMLGYGCALAGTLLFTLAGRSVVVHALALLMTGAGLTLLLYGHLNSRWITPDPVVLTGAIIAFLTALLCVFAAHKPGRFPGAFLRHAMVVSCILVASLVIGIATGGYQINARIQGVKVDLESRLDHWRHVVDSFDMSSEHLLTGMEPGSFASHYAINYPDLMREVGGFGLASDSAGNHFLRLSEGKDLIFGQRLSIRPDQDYQISFNVKISASATIGIYLCERNLIYASNFMPNCAIKALKLSTEQEAWQPVSTIINSAKVGNKPVTARWPTLITFRNLGQGEIIAVDDIRLTALPDSTNLIHNGDFSAGLDRWYFYNDFMHLPWHVKNQWLNIAYDFGLIGLLVFAAALAWALINTLIVRQQASPVLTSLHAALMTGVSALLVFGLFGSPLDSPRPATLFYFALFVLIFARQNASTSARQAALEKV